MTIKKTSNCETHLKRYLFPGEATYLDNEIWPGLFEACNGNRYLIATERNCGRAIVLNHDYLPRLTTIKLDKRHREYGNWWGRLQVRLYHIATGVAPDERPGLISFQGTDCYLSCVGKSGRVSLMRIGFSGEVCRTLCFDGWSLDASSIGHAFLARSADGSYEASPMTFDYPFSHPGVIEVDFNL